MGLSWKVERTALFLWPYMPMNLPVIIYANKGAGKTKKMLNANLDLLQQIRKIV